MIAVLSTVPDRDSDINRSGIVGTIVSVINSCGNDHQLFGEAVTCLAVMCARTRHKNAVVSQKAVPPIVFNLKKFMERKEILIAISRFVAAFATKSQFRTLILHEGGIDAFIVALANDPRDPDKVCAVLRAMWTCAIDNDDVANSLGVSGMLISLLMVLEQHPEHIETHECAMGVLRRIAQQKTFHEEIINCCFLPHIVRAIKLGSEHPEQIDLLKESFGVIGNLAADEWVREQLGEEGVVSGTINRKLV